MSEYSNSELLPRFSSTASIIPSRAKSSILCPSVGPVTWRSSLVFPQCLHAGFLFFIRSCPYSSKVDLRVVLCATALAATLAPASAVLPQTSAAAPAVPTQPCFLYHSPSSSQEPERPYSVSQPDHGPPLLRIPPSRPIELGIKLKLLLPVRPYMLRPPSSLLCHLTWSHMVTYHTSVSSFFL